jgi:tripartite-type tricarboxylate transporter receptor subunit TctC
MRGFKWVATVFFLLLGAAVQAQDYPSRGVRIMVGTPPGGPLDAATRIVADGLGPLWKQPVTVENRPGAGEMLSITTVAKAPPDGYTLLMSAVHTFTINPALYPKLPYDVDSFIPVTLATFNTMAYVTSPKSPFNSMNELLEYAKTQPQGLSWASAGIATINHIAGEQLVNATGAKMVHVPYRGGVPATNAAISGDVPVALISMIQALQFSKSGHLKVLAVTTAQRSSFAPDWPTVSETVLPGFDFAVEVGLFVPAGTPASIVSKLNADAIQVLQMPETKKRLAVFGFEAVGSSPEELRTGIKVRRARIAEIVQKAQIKPE